MKDILFKGKKLFDGEWVTGDLVHSKDKVYIKPFGNAFQVENGLTKFVVMNEVDPDSVEQIKGEIK